VRRGGEAEHKRQRQIPGGWVKRKTVAERRLKKLEKQGWQDGKAQRDCASRDTQRFRDVDCRLMRQR
jgi:hypothetical protein